VVLASCPSHAGQRSSAVWKWFFRSLLGLKMILVDMALCMFAHDLGQILWSHRLNNLIHHTLIHKVCRPLEVRLTRHHDHQN